MKPAQSRDEEASEQLKTQGQPWDAINTLGRRGKGSWGMPTGPLCVSLRVWKKEPRAQFGIPRSHSKFPLVIYFTRYILGMTSLISTNHNCLWVSF